MENELEATISTGEVNVEIPTSTQPNEAVVNEVTVPVASYSQDIPAEAFKSEEEATIDTRPLNVRLVDKVQTVI